MLDYLISCIASVKFTQARRIGIKRQGALGDVLMTTPIIKELRRRYPDAHIWVQTGCKEVFEHHPEIKRVVDHGIERWVDEVIDLDLAYELRPDLHIVDGYSYKAFGKKIEDKRLELFSSKKDIASLKKILQSRIDIMKDRYVALHQAVSWDNRTWPKLYWEAVVERLLQDGFKIAIIGRKKDFSYELDPRVVNLHSQLSLSQIKELIAYSQLFIGPDSGMLHIAMTTQTPIIGLFTIADPQLRVTRDENVISLVPQSACRFCLHAAKAPVTTLSCRYGTNHCVQEISAQQVISAYTQSIALTNSDKRLM